MSARAGVVLLLGLVWAGCSDGVDEGAVPSPTTSLVATPSATAPPASTATSAPTAAFTSTATETRTVIVPSAGRASVAVTLDQGINTSTYGWGSFVIRNGSEDGIRIERVEFDLHGALLRDLVFDPSGEGGDPVGKPFTVDSGGTDAGYLESQLLTPLDGGFQGLTVSFSDFEPGEEFSFSVDIDPTSIKGADPPGPNESGSVSGLELSGATVVVTFSDGQTFTGSLFAAPDDDGGAVAVVSASTLEAPAVVVVGAFAPLVVPEAEQVVEVSGPPGATFELVVVEAGLFLEGVPGGGFDVGPFESNSVIRVEVHSGTIGPSGAAEVPVTLSATGAEGGYYHLVAVLRDGVGVAGRASSVVTVVYRP